MTPQQPPTGEERIDFRDPLQVAVEITELRGKHALLAQEVTLGLRNMFEQQASMQGDMREVERLSQAISGQLHQFQEHSTGLERLAKAIEKQAEADERRWKLHEADNKVVADRVNVWRGVVIGVCVLAGLLASATIYIVNSRFEDAAQQRVRIDQRLDRLEGTRP